MTASLTNAGIVVDSLASALAELDASFLAEFGSGPDGIDLSSRSYTGRQNRILAAREVQVQQLIATVLDLLNVNNAQGRQLDFIGTLLTTSRNPADAATISAVIYGTPGFDAGDRRVRYRRNDTIWRTPSTAVIAANGELAVTLTADIAGETTPAGQEIIAYRDGSAQWVIVDVDSNFTAVESVEDSSPGDNVEGDPSYRARLKVAGRGAGRGTEPGLLRALQAVAGPTATIDNNRNLLPNANGVPGKSIEALFEDGTNDEVAQVMYDYASDTAGFFGTTVGYATTPAGPLAIKITRVALVPIAWDIAITIAGAEVALPDDAVSLVQTALADYTNNQLARGLDVLPSEGAAVVRDALPKGSVPEGGLTVLVGVKGDILAATPVTITSRQRARTNAQPQAAEIVGLNSQPFNIVAGQVLQLVVDGGTPQSVTFGVADFQTISAATTLEVATAINSRTTGVVAGTRDGVLTLATEATGSGAEIEIGTASTVALLGVLGFGFDSATGSNGDITVTVV